MSIASTTMLALSLAVSAQGAVVATTTHGPAGDSFDASILADDYLSGLIATELPGDLGWHPANPAAGNSLNPNGLPAFTDDAGPVGGLTGLLTDFPGAGQPTKRIEYDLGVARDISRINILSGNFGADGRVFSTTAIYFSANDGDTFDLLGYFQSDPSGTTNSGEYQSTLVEIVDSLGGLLATGVTHLQFDLYAVSNTAGEMRDPFDDVNPFTGVDDGRSAAFASPLIWEIDVIPAPAPVSLAVMAMLGSAMGRRRW